MESNCFLCSKYRSQFIWFSRISPYVKLSKSEDSNSELVLNNSASKDLLDLYKYSNLNIGTDFNIFTYKTDSKLFTCNVAAGVLRTKVKNDTIDINNFNVSTVYLNPYFNFQFIESNKIDFNLKVGSYCGWLVTSIDPAMFSSPKKTIGDYITQTDKWWFECGQSINFHPNGDKQSSIFIRTSEYLSTNSNYFTFQIGYATTITNILKF